MASKREPFVVEGQATAPSAGPIGQATETVVFGAGCGGTCDLRTIYLPGGSLIAEETASDVTCPAVPVDCRHPEPSAAAGLRREFSPARPPGLGGGHRALGLADAVAHEPCSGSPVQGYKG
jgi:hypothetical protein